jgi:hypothetical protein
MEMEISEGVGDDDDDDGGRVYSLVVVYLCKQDVH